MSDAFDPKDRSMSRSRGQTLYRYRPAQTFDHPGGYTAQVRQYGRDVTIDMNLDTDYLIDRAMDFVYRWRADGRNAPGTIAGSDRAPEFPLEGALAREAYRVVIPDRVFSRLWPRVFRCAKTTTCGRVWEAPDPRPQIDAWPPQCPSCHSRASNRQLQFLFVHQCGEVRPFLPPDTCSRCKRNAFKLNDRASRFRDFRWECMGCGHSLTVFSPCRRGCPWGEAPMAPLVHTASSAYVGHGITIVNPHTTNFARSSREPPFIVATLGRWLGVCDAEQSARLVAGDVGKEPSPAVSEAIDALEAAGLEDQAAALRREYGTGDLDATRAAVAEVLGFDPLGEDMRGAQLASALSVYQQVLDLDRLTLDRIGGMTTDQRRLELYRRYRPVLSAAGFDADQAALVTDFPVTYLAIGYSRGGFAPGEADLVAYKGRTGKEQPLMNLLYANPTETEALVLLLDKERVGRWLVANGFVDEGTLRAVGGAHRWFAGSTDDVSGQIPGWNEAELPEPGEASSGARALYGLLHTVAHQVQRSLAVDSGYSEQGLSEYIFPVDLGFAIYPNSGSEFTIGGLRTVLEQNLGEVVERAVDNAGCIYDPNCMTTDAGADHGCLHLPETACQSWNRHLSRWYLYGDPEGRWIGYWDPRLAT